MRNLWNIDLGSVLLITERVATMHEDSGQTARWAHRQDAYVPDCHRFA